jgi:hypothetical protein
VDREDVGAAAGGCLFWLVVLTLFGALVWWGATRDKTEGIDYVAGSPPRDMVEQGGCAMGGGECTPPGFEWTLGPGGVIGTRFRLDDPELTRPDGAMRLRSGLFDRCAAVVEWELTTAGGQKVDGRTLSGRLAQEVTGTPPPGTDELVLSARRTDRKSCETTFQWINAGARR